MRSFDASALVKRFPDAEVAFLTVRAKPYGENEPACADAAARILRRLRDTYGAQDALKVHPLREAYRAFYSAMNVKPSAVSTPIKQATRVLERGDYRAIHPVVDTCMEIEYCTLCSVQVYDSHCLGGRILYNVATGNEEVISGAERKCTLRPGELILVDQYGVINSPSCGNDGSRLVTSETSEALVRLLKVPGSKQETFDAAVEELQRRLSTIQILKLNRDYPSA